MPDFKTCIHYRNRKSAELQAASCATTPGIRFAHITMANHYDRLIRMSERSYS